MATTRLTPIHTGKGRSVAKALKDTTDYMKNPLKTEHGEYISSYECDPKTVDAEFLLSKRQYQAATGRDQGERDIVAYHYRQSFMPGEVTPEQANRIGYESVMRFTKGKYAFIVCTHTDRQHIHNHIVWNSTALDCTRKFRNFIGSYFAFRRVSDLICLENGLSIIETPKNKGLNYAKWLGDDRKPSYSEILRSTIDAVLEKKPETFDHFLAHMREEGITVLDSGKHLKFLAPGQIKPTRCDTLRGSYTEQAIRERIAGRYSSSPTGTAPEQNTGLATSLLIDIQAKIQQGKGPGYERWAKSYNLKQMAKTLLILQERGLDDYAVLKAKTEAAATRYSDLSNKIKELEAGLRANANLQKHIINYSKTRNLYVEYRKAGYGKKFRATHEADILLHQTAKKAFDSLGFGKDKKLPRVSKLRAEYADQLEEKKKLYSEYKNLRSEMRALLTLKTNVDRLLNIPELSKEKEKDLLKNNI